MKSFFDKGLWLTVLIASAIVLITFPDLILHGNTAMFTFGGDGIKNYFTVLYYLQNDSGVHFNGMNYPFGEHTSFADAQTGLVVPMQWLSEIFPALKTKGVALINYAVFAGILAGAASIYLLLKQFAVKKTVAVVAALLICFLSPQLFRIEAHFGLSYIFFFPLGCYLYLKAEEKKSLKWILLSILTIAWMGLLHFYLAVIVCMFLFAYALLSTVTGFKKQNRKVLLINWTIPISSMLLLQIFIRLTDHVKDRPSKPWGFFTALADWRTVFLPHSTDLFGKTVGGYPVTAEGFAYVGISAILFLIVFICNMLYHLLLKKYSTVFYPFTKKEMLHFAGSILLLLFAMGIPFIWKMEFLVDRISFLRQFRGLGRFSWPFYYIAAVFTVIYFSRMYVAAKKKSLKVFLLAVMLLLAAVWGAEDFYRMKGLQRLDDAAQRNYLRFNGRNYAQLLAKANHYPGDFQAILCLPFYHIGSEKFSIDYWPSPFYSMKAAHQTGIPMLNVMLSRTSLSQSIATVQLLSDSLIEKKMLTSLKTDKPLLLITSGDHFSTTELQLISKAKLLITDGEIAMYKLPLSAFAINDQVVITTFRNKESNLYRFQHYWSNLSNSNAVLKYIDTSTTLSSAAFIDQSKMKKPVLLDTVFTGYADNDTVHVSLWIKMEPEKDALPLLEIEQISNNKQVAYTELPFKWSNDVYENFVLVSGTFVLKQTTNRVKFTLSQGSIFANLLIRKNREEIYIPTSKQGFYFNNIPVRMK